MKYKLIFYALKELYLALKSLLSWYNSRMLYLTKRQINVLYQPINFNLSLGINLLTNQKNRKPQPLVTFKVATIVQIFSQHRLN